ncbi:hypothetical protein Chor_011658 [Crotalus horridus]
MCRRQNVQDSSNTESIKQVPEFLLWWFHQPQTEVKAANDLHEGTDALSLWRLKSNWVDPKRRSFSLEKMNISNLPRISSMFFLVIFLATIDLSLQQLQSLKDAESVPLGGTVTLSCRYTLGGIANGNHPWWAQQHPGKPPRLLFYNTNIKVSDVPARFSASKSGNVMSLTITGASAEDGAMYYCCLNPNMIDRILYPFHPQGSSIQQLQSLKDSDFVAQGGTITTSCRYDNLSLQQLQSLKDAESVPLGGTVTLSCRYSTEIINDNNYPWDQCPAAVKPEEFRICSCTWHSHHVL